MMPTQYSPRTLVDQIHESLCCSNELLLHQPFPLSYIPHSRISFIHTQHMMAQKLSYTLLSLFLQMKCMLKAIQCIQPASLFLTMLDKQLSYGRPTRRHLLHFQLTSTFIRKITKITFLSHPIGNPKKNIELYQIILTQRNVAKFY